MKFEHLEYDDCMMDVSIFSPADGKKELHAILHPKAELSFEQQYMAVRKALSEYILQNTGFVPVFMRWFLSDSANQQKIVEGNDYPCAGSIIEQPPLDGSKLALWVWMAEEASVRKEEGGMWTADFGGARHIWTTKECRAEGTSEQQMSDMFMSYSQRLASRGCTLKDNCIRTWIFVNNIDINYAGIVKGRRELFEQQGLTSKTHYISSTGIAGRSDEPAASVIMDTYALQDISESQVNFLKGQTHLNPTHEYGVTFERGTAVDHPDRRHVFISGTASIDNKGEIVHKGDITGQTLRMIENVGVLLEEAGCTFDNVMHLIVYLRDIADCSIVRKMIQERFPQHPKVFLWAPVCRPGWLVEMECMAFRDKA